MKEVWTKKWKTVLLWASGYLSFVAYAIVGGYTIVKSEDNELKKTAKKVLIVTLIFTAFSMLLSLISSVGGLIDGYYNSAFYDFYKVLNVIVSIGKIVVYALFVILELVKPEPEKKEEGNTEKAE